MAEHIAERAAIPPYGVAIHESIASGDVARMRRVRDDAERWLAEHGEVADALEALKAEIAKKESGR